MIKIKDLHKNDIIYQVCKYYWIEKIKIVSDELIPYYYKHDCPSQSRYIKGKGTFELNNDNFTLEEQLDIDEENRLYRTYEEAEKVYDNIRNKRIDYLKKDNNLVKELYNHVYNKGKPFAEADLDIFKQLINDCTISFNDSK